jgi:hypothetical protein
MAPVKEDVQAALAEYEPRIRRIVERAWAEWRAVSAFRTSEGFGPILYPRTLANHVFDAIARIAVQEFDTDPSVHVKIEAQTVKFFFKGSVVGRFKKGDCNKLGQNIRTQSALAFMDADGVLPEMPPVTEKVEFIWVANSTQTQLEQVLVTARHYDQLLWDYEIPSTSEADGGSVIPFPTPLPLNPSRQEEDNSELVRPKAPNVIKAEE